VLALGYVVPTVGVAAGPAVPAAAIPTAYVDASQPPAGAPRRLQFAGDARVYGGRVVSFSEQRRSEKAPIPFATRQVVDAGLAAGTTVVDAPGAEGVHTVLFEDQLADGIVVDSTLLQETTTPPAERVVRIGARVVLQPPPADPTADYSRAIAGSATSYCLTGHTATGTLAGPGSIAVDPTVIKLGSHLYVPGYGYGYAVDTGGVIKGTLIDVWLTCDAAIQWGRRQLTIYVLAN
jgi:3D (Asp-Asp-Asp) domain-containing protein